MGYGATLEAGVRGILTEARQSWRAARHRPAQQSATGFPGTRRLLHHYCLVLAAAGLLSGCAWWSEDAAPAPRAELIGVRQLDRDGGETRYLVTVRIVNPGQEVLRISGLTCYLHIDGTLVAEGFSGPLASLPPGSAMRMAVEARANFLGGLKLMTGTAAPSSRDYRLELRLRRPWHLAPLTLTDIGEVNIDK